MATSSEMTGAYRRYRRFVEHLEPNERVGERAFGLIMALTFTLGAGIRLGSDREEAHA